jgi:hypothetical protein
MCAAETLTLIPHHDVRMSLIGWIFDFLLFLFPLSHFSFNADSLGVQGKAFERRKEERKKIYSIKSLSHYFSKVRRLIDTYRLS